MGEITPNNIAKIKEYLKQNVNCLRECQKELKEIIEANGVAKGSLKFIDIKIDGERISLNFSTRITEKLAAFYDELINEVKKILKN